jgi:undecaprenyl-diphosphatase
MPEWLLIVLLGIIEGITEFIPVSSTGHLLLAEHLMPREFRPSDLFTVVIQSGAVLAVIPLFRQRFHQFIYDWRQRETQDYLAKIALAFGITGVGGVLLEKFDFQLPETVMPVAVALLAGGVAFIVIERCMKTGDASSRITWTIAIAVGLGQLLAAVFPGTSRSGSTIALALLLGLNRVAATEFTFLVGIPTMLAAGGLKIAKAFYQGHAASENWPMVGLGFVVSAIVSFLAVKWLLRYVQTHTFVAFGWYRIGLAAVLLGIAFFAAGQ